MAWRKEVACLAMSVIMQTLCVFLWFATERLAAVGDDPLEALFVGFKLVIQRNSLIGGGVQSVALRWVSRRRRVSPTQELYECILIWLGCVDPRMRRYFAAPSMASLVR